MLNLSSHGNKQCEYNIVSEKSTKDEESERLKFSIIIGDYWRVPEGSKFSGEKIISTGEWRAFKFLPKYKFYRRGFYSTGVQTVHIWEP